MAWCSAGGLCLPLTSSDTRPIVGRFRAAIFGVHRNPYRHGHRGDDLRLDLDAWKRRIEWRRPQIEQARRAGADEDAGQQQVPPQLSP